MSVQTGSASKSLVQQPLRLQIATFVVVATACILFAPPLGLDGRLSHLESALVVLAIVLGLAMARPPVVNRVPTPVLVVALLTVMAASTLWTFSRVDTVRDVVAFAVIALAAIVLVQISSLNTLAVGVALSGLLLLGWAVLLLFIAPEMVFNSSGALIAPYGNRNGLAYSLLEGVPAALAMKLTFSNGSIVKWFTVVALSVGVVATTSKTSLLVLGVLGCIVVVGVVVRRRRVFGLIVAAVAVIVVALGALNFGRVLEIFGKGTSINGRIPIWEALFPLIGQRPLTGYGWSMSWPVGAPPSRAVQDSLDGVLLFHAHNEVLNWLITTGIVGCALVLGIYGHMLWAGMRLFREPGIAAGTWILLGATMLFLRGLSDISETAPQGWFVLVILAAASVKYRPRAVGRTLPKWISVDIVLHKSATTTS